MKEKTEAEDLKMKATFSSQDRGEIAWPVTALLNIIIENLVKFVKRILTLYLYLLRRKSVA